MLERAKRLQELRTTRAKLEAAAKELKAEEVRIQESILQTMFEDGIQSVHYPEIGRLVRVNKTHYEIFDKEAFAKGILMSLTSAKAAGRPLAESALAQMRVSRESLEAYLGDTPEFAQTIGVRQVDKPELSFRKN